MTQKPKTASSLLQKFTRDPNYVNRLQGLDEVSSGKEWDNRFTTSKIPQYDAFNDRFCKFSMRRRAPSASLGKAPPPAHPMSAWSPVAAPPDRLHLTQQGNPQGGKAGATQADLDASLGGPIQSVEQMFAKAKQRIIKLWDELGVAESQRLQFAQHAMALPTLDNIQIINEEIQRLLDRRNAAVQVEKAVEVREGFLYLLQELAERYSNGVVDKDRALREILSLVTPFRNSCLDVVEAIVRWRETLRNSGISQSYLWKGVSYLHKMNSDLFFLVHSRLGLLLDFEVRNNPLLDPRKQVESVAGGKLAPIRRAKDTKDLPKERLERAEKCLQEELQRQQHLQLVRAQGGDPDVMVIDEETHLANLARDEQEQQQLIIEEDQWLQQQQREAKLHDAQTRAAVKIQKMYRGFLARRLVGAKVRQRFAVIKMQTLARQFIAKLRVQKLRRQVNAARKLQALHRGVSTRGRIYDVRRHHDAAQAIQRVFRGYLGRKYADLLAYLRSCARKIQALWRGHQARRFVQRVVLYKRVAAAIRIQALWRGVSVRINPRYSPMRIKCAIRIQAWVRGILDREFAKQLLVERRQAIRIQSWWRMLIAKKRAAAMREVVNAAMWQHHLARAHEAATKIQSLWRMVLAMDRVAALREGRLSNLARAALESALKQKERDQELLLAQNAGAVRIQKVFRGYLGRQRVDFLKQLHGYATQIQRIVRGRIGRVKARRQRDILASTMPAMFKMSEVEAFSAASNLSVVAEAVRSLAEARDCAAEDGVDASAIAESQDELSHHQSVHNGQAEEESKLSLHNESHGIAPTPATSPEPPGETSADPTVDCNAAELRAATPRASAPSVSMEEQSAVGVGSGDEGATNAESRLLEIELERSLECNRILAAENTVLNQRLANVTQAVVRDASIVTVPASDDARNAELAEVGVARSEVASHAANVVELTPDVAGVTEAPSGRSDRLVPGSCADLPAKQAIAVPTEDNAATAIEAATRDLVACVPPDRRVVPALLPGEQPPSTAAPDVVEAPRYVEEALAAVPETLQVASEAVAQSDDNLHTSVVALPAAQETPVSIVPAHAVAVPNEVVALAVAPLGATPRTQERAFAVEVLRNNIGAFATRTVRREQMSTRQRVDTITAIAQERTFAASTIQRMVLSRLLRLRRRRADADAALVAVNQERDKASQMISRALRLFADLQLAKYRHQRRLMVIEALSLDQERHTAARKLQSMFRCWRARRYCAALRVGHDTYDVAAEQVRQTAARMIQRMVRRAIARSDMLARSPVKPAPQVFLALLQEQYVAAVMIQCRARAFAAKNRVDSLRAARKARVALSVPTGSASKSPKRAVSFNNQVSVISDSAEKSVSSAEETIHPPAESSRALSSPVLPRSTVDDQSETIARLEEQLREAQAMLRAVVEAQQTAAASPPSSQTTKPEHHSAHVEASAAAQIIERVAAPALTADDVLAEQDDSPADDSAAAAATTQTNKPSAVKEAGSEPTLDVPVEEGIALQSPFQPPVPPNSIVDISSAAPLREDDSRTVCISTVVVDGLAPQPLPSTPPPAAAAAAAAEVSEARHPLSSTPVAAHSAAATKAVSLPPTTSVIAAPSPGKAQLTPMEIVTRVNACLRQLQSANICAYWREKQLRNRLKTRRTVAAVKIQCAVRCHLARARVYGLREARRLQIQDANDRAAQAERQRASATELEAARREIANQVALVRSADAEKERAAQLKRDAIARRERAALTIQCAYRCYNARFMLSWKRIDRHKKRIAEERRDFSQLAERAAVKIQCAVRRFVAQRTVERLRDEKRAAREAVARAESLRHIAATKIQCMYRVYNAKFEVGWRREERKLRDERELAAKRAEEHDAIRAVQQKEQLQRLQVRRKAAAITIQCAWRCYNARFELMWRVEARAKAQADAQLARRGAVLCRIAQRIGRGFLTRKRLYQERAFAHTLAAQELLLAEYEADSVINDVLTV